MENQTAVEWLRQKLQSECLIDMSDELFNQAKKMEKEQKRLDYIAGHDLCRCVTDNTDEAKECFEEYYNLWKIN